MRRRYGLLGVLLALSASPALAEVSDKIPSLANLWLWAAGFTLAALLLAWRRPVAGLAVVPFAAFWAWSGHEMLSDPWVGPAILREQGRAYVQAVYWSAAAGVTGPLLVAALALWLRLRKAAAMTVQGRHDYRLSARDPAFFTAALERALLQPPEIIVPGDPNAGRYNKRRTFLWDLFGAGEEGFDFHLVAYSAAGPPEDAHQLARRVFASLIAMDDAARAIPVAGDENEYLFSVTLDLDNGVVQLDYAASTVNTEWTVHFLPGEDGTFTCLGIPDWRNPGRFII